MNPRCNMREEEKEKAMGLFSFPCLEDLVRAKRAFRKYIFYDTWGRRNFREVFCPECGRFDIERENGYDPYRDNFFDFHHNDTVCCPLCGTEGTLICLGRMRTMSSLTSVKKMVLLQERDGILLAQAGTMKMEYEANDLDPYPWWTPEKRYAFHGDRRQAWKKEWQASNDTRPPIWTPMKTVGEPFPDGYNMGGGYLDGSYTVIGAEAIGKTSLRYSQCMEFFAGKGTDLWELERVSVRGVIPYLAEYTRRPQLEMLVKLDHTDVVEDLLRGDAHALTLDWKAKTPQKFFQLSRENYRRFRTSGGKVRDLEEWRRVMPGSDFSEWLRLHELFGHHLGEFLRMFGMDPRREKIIRWYAEQESHCEGIWAVWQDTLKLEEELGNDITHDGVIMPEDLRRRHDEASELRNALRRKETQKKYGVRYRDLKKRYGYSDGALSIVIPACAEEIENEGALLRHCVAGYADRHIKGIKTIVFLRWKDDIETPYMTIEVSGARIEQINGYRNECTGKTMRPMDIHGEFLEEWTEWLRQGSPRGRNGKPIRPRMNEETEDIAV